jgi:hypothetical protein
MHDLKWRFPGKKICDVTLHLAAIRNLKMRFAVFQDVPIGVEGRCGECMPTRLLQAVTLTRNLAQHVERRPERPRIGVSSQQIDGFVERIARLRRLTDLPADKAAVSGDERLATELPRSK